MNNMIRIREFERRNDLLYNQPILNGSALHYDELVNTAPKKRLELYTHTKMSALDGKIKILYRIKSCFINDMLPIINGSADSLPDREFIVFDLEPTGLNPKTERIIEIGAVRVKNGEITENFNTFVNPRMPIPQK